MKAVRVRVTGRVQGVFFRASTRRKAVELGLAGTVCNLPDGSVEIVAQGDATALEALLDWCRHGPPDADVAHVEVSAVAVEGHTKFQVLR